ncbi:MAG: ATP-dependent helicase [Patescibacteria group bacterium]
MAEEEKKLNKEQLEAVQHGEGPLLIIAGAGTGKTTVITERIKYLVSSGKAKPSEILALTFTDKAAREMEERVDVAMPYGYTQMWISTFHAFCDRVLRAEALHIGLDPKYNLLTEAETVQFLRTNLFKFDLKYFRPLGNPNKFIAGMLQHFSRLKDEDVSPEEYMGWVQGLDRRTATQKAQKNSVPSDKFGAFSVAGGVSKTRNNFPEGARIETEEAKKYLELAKAYKTYEELKVKESVMDFADLISNTLKLFRTRKNVLKEYQDQFKYILVDEFQDTNYAQNELAMLLAGRRANLTVTGDDDQSIYRFRGAAVSNIIQFRQNYPKAKIVVLTKNYRSTQEILDRAYQLIQNNNPDRLEVKEKIDKKLEGMRGIGGEKIGFIKTDRVENEAEAVAKKIIELSSNQATKKYNFKDFAILVRANNHADAFVRALSRQGIPYQFLGPGMLFRQAEVKDLICYLKVLANFEDSVAMYRILAMDFFDVSPRDLAAISNFAKKNNLSLFEACEKIEKIFVSQKTRETVEKLVKMVHRHLGLIKKETAGQILYYFLQDCGLLRKLAEYKTPVEERRAQNISKFFDKLKTYEVEHEDASVFAVSDWIDLSLELGESPLAADMDWTEIDAVNILTVHSAKGLEFPVVFLVNLVAQRFPTIERREQIPIPEPLIKEILPVGDYHLEEERRLFYVGMTRARDRLYFTAADFYGEGKRERKLSPFVLEALGEDIKKLRYEDIKEGQQLSILDWQKKPEAESHFPLPTSHFPINYLSFSQIDTFDTCPLQYRYKFIQRIPVPPSAAASFGDSIHKTLRDFYQGVKKGERLTKKDLLKTLETNWSSQGYASRAHEEKMKKTGERMLSDFYEKFDSKIVPRDLEQPFIIKVSPDLKIGGKIDRIDEKEGKLEIIDYKTGKILDQKDIDKSLQMMVYALAATDEGLYGKKPEEVILTFYFLENLEKKSTKRTAEQLEQAKKELVEKAKGIEKSKFEPIPGPWCDFCDFKLICEAWT